jgi:hypothetical protein
MNRIRTSVGISLMVVTAAMMAGCYGDTSSAAGTASSGAGANQKQDRETLVIPTGTTVVASLDTSLSTDLNHSGDAFTATVNQPVVVDGRTLMPSGSQIHGVLQDVEDSGRIKGRARMTLLYQSIVDPDGQQYGISAVPLTLQAASETNSDIEKIAAGAVLGAIVGGIADGSKGAAIGAGAGAGAGTIYMLATKGDDLELNPGQRLAMHMTKSMSVQVPVS